MERLPKQDMLGESLLSASHKLLEGDTFLHFHDFYEIEYVLSGDGVSIVNGKEAVCESGLLCFLTPIDSHSVRRANAWVYNIMFSEQLVPFDLLAPFLGSFTTKMITVPEDARPLVEQLCAETVENQADARYCALLVSCLLRKLAGIFPTAQANVPSDVFSAILSYIISHYRTPITLQSAAAQVGLTPSYVSALFKKEMGVGFKSYLNSLRLEYARKLLISTEESVRQICEESGFEDLPNFIKRFKAYFGVSPTGLRKTIRDKS